ncbi:MAG: RsmE family RNA methyltransferase [Armatimonas sp.]
MPLCFFVTRNNSDTIALPADKAHHVHTVLRMRSGDGLMLHDGAGFAAEARLVSVEKRGVTARIITEWKPVATEPERQITVFQALPKIGEKAEQIVQHGVELGAAAFVFFGTEKSISLEGQDRIRRKVSRWEDIARNAAEQSGRGIVPPVYWEEDIPGALTHAEGLTILVGTPGANLTLSEAALDNNSLALFMGPESGFTAAEEKALGGVAVSLGPRILRTETAALAALARLLL